MTEEQRPTTIKNASEELMLWVDKLEAGSVPAIAMNDYIGEEQASSALEYHRRLGNTVDMQSALIVQALIKTRINDRLASLPGYGPARTQAIKLTTAAYQQFVTERKMGRLNSDGLKTVFFDLKADNLYAHFSRAPTLPQSPKPV